MIIKRVFITFHILISVLVLVLTFFSTNTGTNEYLLSSALSPFLVPLLIINVILFVVSLLMHSWFIAVLPFIALVSSYKLIPAYLQFNYFTEAKILLEENAEDIIKIQSYNTHQFKYNEFTESSLSIGYTAFENQSDIVCFQEFRNREMHEQFYNSYLYSAYSNEKLKSGLAIFSKFPILKTEIIDLPDSDRKLLLVDIKKDNYIFKVLTIHLQSTSISRANTLRKNGYNFISNAKIRRKQVDLISDIITESKYPVILCGDFNDTPNSYTYYKFKSILEDAFVSVGNGYAYSYRKALSLLRIDYFFYSEEIEPLDFYYKSYPMSDHRAGFFSFRLKEKKN